MDIRNRIGDLRFMKALFTTAEAEARDLGDDLPGAEHLLLAALSLPDASGRQALATWTATVDDVRAAARAVHAEALRSVGLASSDADPGSASTGASFRLRPALPPGDRSGPVTAPAR